MQQRQYAPQSHSQTTLLILASLITRPQTATALREGVYWARGRMIEPVAFSRLLARLEQRGLLMSDEREQRLCLYHLTASGRQALQQGEMERQSNQENREQDSGRQQGKERLMRLVLWLLRLYPPAWRERYEMEMVALLEQHQITLWTVLDLLVGALDARLDPHYRQPRPLLPLRRIQNSWRLVIGAFIVFWLALLPWFWLSMLGPCDDVGNPPSPSCVFGSFLGAHEPAFSSFLLGAILLMLPILLVVFTLALAQARKMRARVHLLLAFLVTLGMLAISITCGLWYLSLWQILPQINQYAPYTPLGMLLGLIGMALASVLSGSALLRATFALRSLSAASPRQEFHPALVSVQAEPQFEQASNQTSQTEPSATSSLAQKEKESSWLSKGVLAVLLLLFLLPWPSLVNSQVSLQNLLRQLFFAGIVGGITALLVMVGGKRSAPRKRRSSGSPGFRRTSLPWLVVPLLLILVAFIIPLPLSGPVNLLVCFLVLAGDFILFVIVRALRPPRDWLSLAVTALLAFVMLLVFLCTTQFLRPSTIFSWLLWVSLSFAACLCISPALIVRVYARNVERQRLPRRRGHLSPRAWIIILPVWFLVFCIQVESLFFQSSDSFADVFIAWLMTGLAGLIIALAVKLGSKGQVDLSRTEEPYQTELEPPLVR